MPLLWGVHPILCPKLTTTEQMVTVAEHLLQEAGYLHRGDILGIVAGTRTLSGSTNFLRLHVAGDQVPGTTPTRVDVPEPVHA